MKSEPLEGIKSSWTTSQSSEPEINNDYVITYYYKLEFFVIKSKSISRGISPNPLQYKITYLNEAR